jgi:hypothetical protein
MSVSTSLRYSGGAEVQVRSFLTAALAGGEWSTSQTARLTHGKEQRYPLNKSLGGPQTQSGLHFWRR